jgi:hypothetical protein
MNKFNRDPCLFFWNRTKKSYSIYKSENKKIQILSIIFNFIFFVSVTVLCIFVFILGIGLSILSAILSAFWDMLKDWSEQNRIRSIEERNRRAELRRIYEDNKAAGLGFGQGFGYGNTVGRNRADRDERYNATQRRIAQENYNRVFTISPSQAKRSRDFWRR